MQEAKYNEIFELCREKGLKISGDMFARLISIYQEQDLYIDHSIVYCPGICLAVFFAFALIVIYAISMKQSKRTARHR